MFATISFVTNLWILVSPIINKFMELLRKTIITEVLVNSFSLMSSLEDCSLELSNSCRKSPIRHRQHCKQVGVSHVTKALSSAEAKKLLYLTP